MAVFISSFAVIFETPNRRKELALYLTPKVVEGIHNFFLRRRLLPEIP